MRSTSPDNMNYIPPGYRKPSHTRIFPLRPQTGQLIPRLPTTATLDPTEWQLRNPVCPSPNNNHCAKPKKVQPCNHQDSAGTVEVSPAFLNFIVLPEK